MKDKRNIKIYETKERVTADNEIVAKQTASYLEENRCFMINLMSSPGAGKTTTLVRTIEALGDRYSIGVLEADVDSYVDAQTIIEAGGKSIQLHTGGSCHMDADMTWRGLEKLGLEDLDLVVLENIGNLVCPAEFDTGAHRNVMILSYPEGDDKPLKYPLMFSVCDCLLINKIDTAPIFDFDMEALEDRVKKLNPDIKIIPVSSKENKGIDVWTEWLSGEIEEWRKSL